MFVSKSLMDGMGNGSEIVSSFRALKSTTGLKVPSLLAIRRRGDDQGELDGSMIPCSSNPLTSLIICNFLEWGTL